MGCATSLRIAPASRENKEPETAYHGDSAITFTERQKQIVNKTWKYLANDLTGRGSKVFLRIFELAPHVKQLFPCRHAEGDELLKNPNFKGHASRFMQAVGAVVDNLGQLQENLSPLLINLGKQHINFPGFKPEDFDFFAQAMTFIWTQDLKLKFTDEAKEAWALVFDFIMTKLKEGYRLAIQERQNKQIEM